MDELVRTLDRYFEFLVLGALLLGIVAAFVRATFGHSWTEVGAFVFPELGTVKHPNLQLAWRGSIMVGCLFLMGFSVNVLGYWLLHPAHLYVIRTVSANIEKPAANKPDPYILEPGWEFYLRPASRRIETAEKDSHRVDSDQQMRWMIGHRESHKESTEWVLKPTRIVRGLILLSTTLFLVSLLVVVLRLLPAKSAKPRGRWAASAAVAALLYWLTMGMYWQYEFGVHQDIWISKKILNELKSGDLRIYGPDSKKPPAE
jgi:hypothetical protein